MIVPGQHVLQRTSIVITTEFVEARCTVALPARGRTILGQAAVSLVCHQLIEVARSALYYSSLNHNMLRQHVESVEDQEYLRGQLDGAGLVGFVINGAVLPRRSGVDDKPMSPQQEPNLVYFQSPPSLEVAFNLPNHGTVAGMGVRKGITLIIGGGFHGKTTLLEALEVGIYNKIPGDGREFVVVDSNAVKVRSEDGRVVTNVDISPFINNLPFGKQTEEFNSEDASGSTSQAANILEAVEQGASTLLVDEDTCATNFMIRDARMQVLVAKEKEPITAFLFRVRPLFYDRGVSTIMVVGGSGDFFDVADTVLQLDMYQARDVTTQAKEIASMMGNPHQQRATQVEKGVFCLPRKRIVNPDSLTCRGKTKSISTRAISYGDVEIDLSGVEQLVEHAQTMAITDCMKSLARSPLFDGKRTLADVARAVTRSFANETAIGINGLDTLSPYPTGNYSMLRHFELAFAINRLRGLKVRSVVAGSR